METNQTVDTLQQYPWITMMPERFVCSVQDYELDAIVAFAFLKAINPKCLLDRRSSAEIEMMDAKEHPTYAIWVGNPKSGNVSAFRDIDSYVNYIGRFAIPDTIYDVVVLDVIRRTLTTLVGEEGHSTLMEETITSSIFLEEDAGNFDLPVENPYAGEFSYKGDEAFLRCAQLPIECIKSLLKCYSRLIEIDHIVYDAVVERNDDIVVLPRPTILTNHHCALAQDDHKNWFVIPLRPPKEGVEVRPIIPYGELAPMYAKFISRPEMRDLIEKDDGVVRADPRFQWYICKSVDDAIAFIKRVTARALENKS